MMMMYCNKTAWISLGLFLALSPCRTQSFTSRTTTTTTLHHHPLYFRHGSPSGSQRYAVTKQNPMLLLLYQQPKKDMDDQDSSTVTQEEQEKNEFIVRGEKGDEFSEEFWQELEQGQPSEWNVMKQLLGINIFTYILAAAIAFFLSMNAIFGEGWLGSTIGLQGTGTFTERSEKLPNVVDLSEDRFQI